jgi:outer membrane protein TolC
MATRAFQHAWIFAFGLAGLGCATSKPAKPTPPANELQFPAKVAAQSESRPQVALTAHQDEASRDALNFPETPVAPAAIAANAAHAPHGEPLTLETLETLACQNNPTLLQAQGQIQGELGKAIQAGLWPNPTLSYVQEQIGVSGTPGEFAGGTVKQRVVTGRKLDLSRAKYLARTQAAEWHALEQQYRVLNDVRMHYFRARGHFELVEIHRDLLKSADDNVLTVREQFNVGQATRAQVHMANVALQRARLDLLKSENDYRQAFETLASVVGVDLPLTPLATPLDGDLTPIDYDEALSHLVVQSPQLQAARSKLESDRITIRRELVQPIPDLVVEGGVGRNFEADGTVAMARLGIEVPIFDWNQGTIRQAEADYARQQGEVRRLELVLKKELAKTYRDYLTALQYAENYANVILPEARSAYELQLRSYQEDRIDWSEVLRTQEDYFMLRAEYVRNLITWRESEILITGFLLHGGLMAPTTPSPSGHIDSLPKPR